MLVKAHRGDRWPFEKNHERSPRGYAQLLEGDDQTVTLDVAGRELRLARDKAGHVKVEDVVPGRYQFYVTAKAHDAGPDAPDVAESRQSLIVPR
jgi:hypothetical protein